MATAITLISSGSPSATGYPVTFTASVTTQSGATPTGSVTFKDGAIKLGMVTLAYGQAALTTSSLPLGNNAITATYSGDSTFAASTSAALTQTVEAEPTTIYLSSNANPSLTGQGVTFTATVVGQFGDAPSGTVTFLNDGVALTTVALTTNSQGYGVAAILYGFGAPGAY